MSDPSPSDYSHLINPPRSTPNSTASSTSAPGHVSHSYPPPPPSSASSTEAAGVTTPASKIEKGLALYACGHCGRRYSRPEHLQRHVQSHTLGRRFACGICGKTFARADLKKRHEANHENDDSRKRRRNTTALNTGRVTHACKACAAARVKCQEEKPCQRCVNRGLACISAEAGSTAANLSHLSASTHANTTSGDEDDSADAASEYAMASASNFHHQQSTGQAFLSQQLPFRNSEPQLATPETGNIASGSESGPLDSTDAHRLPFCDFLRDVLYEQQYGQSARTAESQGMAVLDFCDDNNLEMSDIDFGLLDHWNTDGMTGTMPTQQQTPKTDNSGDIAQMQNLVTAWDVSPWRWDPVAKDNAYGEQGNLPVSKRDVASIQAQATKGGFKTVVDQKLDCASRDGVLALILSACQPDSMSSRISSSFPSSDILDIMLHVFFTSHMDQVSEWIHFPTFKLNEQEPEWIAGAVAAGAVLTPIPTLRKFGYALQESAIVLGQDTGLWSGNRRKMEIAECHVNIPATMMRYRGKFQRSSYPLISVDSADEGPILEQKWRSWVTMEKWKRFVFHLFLRDSQQSMAALTNPVMSYAELTLPLPSSKELWYARTAKEWKHVYLQREAGHLKRAPSVADLIRDLNLLDESRHRLDVQFSATIYLQAFWLLILEYRNLCSSCRVRSYTEGAFDGYGSLLDARRRQLLQDLQAFQTMTINWPEITAQERLLFNQLMMSLHVSLDDLQLFAGKEGDEQARRAFPLLQQWVESVESRTAVWHAGQILRFAKLFPSAKLKNSYAVGVHHAALALWTYGVITRALRQEDLPHQPDKACIDGSESMAVRRYITLAQGLPIICGPSRHNGVSEASIENPQASMEAIYEILQANFEGGNNMAPAIVENLCVLIRQLGNVAWAVGLG
ncbi:hypothetical protein F66182_8972 [Fusarium sp. NRRL 66182]|nr:hypothetical protein F66182_8972 [Fusarium sp. NRRL 66182]